MVISRNEYKRLCKTAISRPLSDAEDAQCNEFMRMHNIVPCGKCRGVGEIEDGEVCIKCPKCKGKGVLEDSKIYRDNGYNNRLDYLKSLAEEYDVPIEYVQSVADLFGPSEDFDGLISTLESADDLDDYYFGGEY